MSEFDNTNSGVLFKNDKPKSDKSPGYTGTININGVDHWLSAWVKEGKKGKFFSLSIGDVKEKQSNQPAQPVQPDINDDIPF